MTIRLCIKYKHLSLCSSTQFFTNPENNSHKISFLGSYLRITLIFSIFIGVLCKSREKSICQYFSKKNTQGAKSTPISIGTPIPRSNCRPLLGPRPSPGRRRVAPSACFSRRRTLVWRKASRLPNQLQLPTLPG